MPQGLKASFRTILGFKALGRNTCTRPETLVEMKQMIAHWLQSIDSDS
jgi:hypothetical protein